MTLAILIFNFYPVTAIMIVMLALLNDGAILSIAYDNVHYKDQSEAWNMRVVLGISGKSGRKNESMRPIGQRLKEGMRCQSILRIFWCAKGATSISRNGQH